MLAIAPRRDGLPLFFLCIMRDASENKWTSEELNNFDDLVNLSGQAIYNSVRFESLRVQDSYHRAFTEACEGGIVFIDASGQVSFVNDSFELSTGISKNKLLGRSFRELVAMTVLPADQDTFAREIQQSMAQGTTRESLPLRLQVTGGSISSSTIMSIVAVRSPLSKGKYGVVLSSIPLGVQEGVSEEASAQPLHYESLVENSDGLFFRVDKEQSFKFVSKRALDFFGESPAHLLEEDGRCWLDFLDREDSARLRRTLLKAGAAKSSYEDEVRVSNQVTGKRRWLLVRMIAQRDDAGLVHAWDGFAVDVTNRRELENEQREQGRRTASLYSVVSATRGLLDSTTIASRGLEALCESVESPAGMVLLHSFEHGKKLDLIAQKGFSEEDESRLLKDDGLMSLSHYVAKGGQAVHVSDITTDPRVGSFIAEMGLRSVVFVPIRVEEESLGTLVLFQRAAHQFSDEEEPLFLMAASHIGLATRQASLFAAFRSQTKNLSALYTLSHELSKKLSVDEMFQNAFRILRDELGLKRLWLGLLNEPKTRIIGQAAYGPGWKKRLVEINVDISGRDHPLAKVVSSKSPIVVDRPAELLRGFGGRRLFSQMDIETVFFVPLVASGQSLGVLAAEPSFVEKSFDEDELKLLSSLANELAVVLLTKRLEDRIAEGDRMRTTGLLAAGVAHNFNNLLQAILGQASLLEMQGGSDERIRKSAKIISDASTRGAFLVKQLLNFANVEEPMPELVNVNSVIERNAEVFRQMLVQNQQLEIHVTRGLPRVDADPRQIVQILSSLAENAAEAMDANGKLEISTHSITSGPGTGHDEVPHGNYAVIGVRDSGRGMDEETRKRCFEPFYTTKNLDPLSGLGLTGSGLGLAAAYALALRNGGRLVVDSRLGHGSLFSLYLPIAESASEEIRETRRSVVNGSAVRSGTPSDLESELIG